MSRPEEAVRATGIRLVPRPAPTAARQPVSQAPASPGQLAQAVILAGGHGTRLRPRTRNRPKPLTTIGRHSVIEVLLRQLQAAGVGKVALCVSYLAEMVEKALGDGSRFGIELEYYADPGSLGTAGPLTALPVWPDPILVLNGDVLTQLDFAELYRSHLASGAPMTAAVHVTSVPIGYGIVDLSGGRIHDLWEKPELELNVCAGVYVLSPQARAAIPVGRRFDMTDLIHRLLGAGHPVNAFRFREEWHDIGTASDLARARRSFAEQPSAYLRGGLEKVTKRIPRR